jgi:hypothetical protein
VDSIKAPGSDGASGGYTLTVFETPSNDTCAEAEALTWTGTKATASGVLTAASDTVDMMTSTTCNTVGPTPGPDLFYEIDLTAGQMYRASVPNAGAAIYVFTDCSNVTGSCIAGAPYADGLIFTPAVTGKHLIGVDMGWPMRPGQPAINFTLTVEEVTAPQNDSCATAEALTFTAGKATTTGDFSLATNTLDMGPANCTTAATPGPDLFYSASVTAGKSYRVTLDPMMPVFMYVVTDCANPTTSCVFGSTDPKFPQMEFTATQSGTHIIGLDTDPMMMGPGNPPFTLTVEEFTPAPNNDCGGAEALTFTGGKATATVDFSNASNTQSMGMSTCVARDTFGPDLFYEIPVTAGMAYAVSIPTSPMSSLFPVLYVFASCSGGPASCVAASGFTGGTELSSWTTTTHPSRVCPCRLRRPSRSPSSPRRPTPPAPLPRR